MLLRCDGDECLSKSQVFKRQKSFGKGCETVESELSPERPYTWLSVVCTPQSSIFSKRPWRYCWISKRPTQKICKINLGFSLVSFKKIRNNSKNDVVLKCLLCMTDNILKCIMTDGETWIYIYIWLWNLVNIVQQGNHNQKIQVKK